MPHPVDIHVGSVIRRRRRDLGMTQQALATQVGIKFQQIQKYETGANRVSASRLWEISGALGVPVSYFFEGIAPGAGAGSGPSGAATGRAAGSGTGGGSGASIGS